MKQRVQNLNRNFDFGSLAILVYGASSIIPDSLKWLQLLVLLSIGLLAFANSFKTGALAFSVLAICLLGRWPVLGNLWPAPSLLVGAIVGLLLWSKKDLLLKNQFRKVRRGELILSILLGFLSAGGVWVWFWLSHPTPDEIIFKLPFLPSAILIPAVIVISALNSFSEELLFRGLAFDAVSERRPNERTANIVQAFAFGVFHFKGFPFGLSGSVLAFVFGYLMGILRVRSKGLFLPWVAHFTADLLIMVILCKM